MDVVVSPLGCKNHLLNCFQYVCAMAYSLLEWRVESRNCGIEEQEKGL